MKHCQPLIRVARAAVLVLMYSTTHAQPANTSPALSSAPPSQLPAAGGIRVEPSLEDLVTRLNLNDQQKVLWRKLETRVQAWEQNLYKEQPVWSADANAVAEMGRLTLNQQNRLSLLEDLEIAVKTLHANLRPEQQAVLNSSLIQAIPGLLPSNARNVTVDAPTSRRQEGRYGGSGSGHRRSGGFGAMN